MRLKVITPPTSEPVTIEDARLHLRIDAEGGDPAADPPVPPSHPDDPLIERAIVAAREWIESFTGRWLVEQTVEIAADCFYDDLDLGSPVQSIEFVKYRDGSGVEQTLDPIRYELDDFAQPARLRLPYGGVWPITANGWPSLNGWTYAANSVKVRAVVGPVADEPIPASLRAAMLLVIGHLYENRENAIVGPRAQSVEVPLGAASLAWPYRIRLGV